VNPFTGASVGRTFVGELPQRPKTSSGGKHGGNSSSGGQAGRVRELQLRIDELERSATSMYTQVRCGLS
jgi:hypothetical protein